MFTDDLPLPDFLRISQQDRREAWKGRKLTKPRAKDITITRNEDAATRAFRREVEKQKAAKKKAALLKLRETYSSKPRRKVK